MLIRISAVRRIRRMKTTKLQQSDATCKIINRRQSYNNLLRLAKFSTVVYTVAVAVYPFIGALW
jgi:hypothetical protein